MADIYGKDTRGQNSRAISRKLHHSGPKIAGPDTITKRVNNNEDKHSSSDPLGLASANVGYSMNKAKRWTAGADELASSRGRIAFVSASVPRTAIPVGPTRDRLHLVADKLALLGGGIHSYTEIADGEVVVDKECRSKKGAELSSIESQPGPGPYSRRERRNQKDEEKRLRKLEATLKQRGISPNAREEKEETAKTDVTYEVVRLTEGRAGRKEGLWRKQQRQQMPTASARHRTRMLVQDDHADKEDQEYLEATLEDDYERHIDATIQLKDFAKNHLRDERIRESNVVDPAAVNARIDGDLNRYRASLMDLRPQLRFGDKSLDAIKHVADKCYLDAHPPTYLVHARSFINSAHSGKSCMIVREQSERIAAYPAPEFCCIAENITRFFFPPETWETVMNKGLLERLDWISWDEHQDNRNHTTADKCYACGKGRNMLDAVEPRSLGLLALACRHYACDACWLGHVRRAVEKGEAARCWMPNCGQLFSYTHAAILFTDEAHEAYASLLRGHPSNVFGAGSMQCSVCPARMMKVDLGKHHGKREVADSPMHSVYCMQCHSLTCVICEGRYHLPLACNDAAKWNQMIFANFFTPLTNEKETYTARKSWRHVEPLKVTKMPGQCLMCKDDIETLVRSQVNGREFCTACGDGFDLEGGRLRIPSVAEVGCGKDVEGLPQVAHCLSPRFILMDMLDEDNESRENKTELRRFHKLMIELVNIAEAHRVRKVAKAASGFKKAMSEELADELLEYEDLIEATLAQSLDTSKRLIFRIHEVWDVVRRTRERYEELCKS